MKFFLVLLAFGIGLATPAAAQDAADCAALRQKLTGDPSLEISERHRLEGLARYQGECFERDATRGIELLVEAARADNGRATIDLATLTEKGEHIEAAALVVFEARQMPRAIRANLDPMPKSVKYEAAFFQNAFDSADARILLARVRSLLAWTPFMRGTEKRFIDDVTRILMLRGNPEAFYLRGIENLEWIGGATTLEEGYSAMQAAAVCGFPDAIRWFALSMADGKLPADRQADIVARLESLHTRTGEEAWLLRRLNVEPASVVDHQLAERISALARADTQACRAAVQAAWAAVDWRKSDWRQIVTEVERARMENWEANFRSALEATISVPPIAWHGIDRETLLQLDIGTAIPFDPQRLAGRWRCRFISASPNSVNLDDWFHCRIRFDGKFWELEKRGGQKYLGGVLLPDAALGTVFVGADWSSGGRDLYYGEESERNNVGVVRRLEGRRIRLMMPYFKFFHALEIDLSAPLLDRHFTVAPGWDEK